MAGPSYRTRCPQLFLFFSVELLLVSSGGRPCEARTLLEKIQQDRETDVLLLLAVGLVVYLMTRLLRKTMCRGPRQDSDYPNHPAEAQAEAEAEVEEEEEDGVKPCLFIMCSGTFVPLPACFFYEADDDDPRAINANMARSPPQQSLSESVVPAGSPSPAAHSSDLEDFSPAKRSPLKRLRHRDLKKATSNFHARKEVGSGASGVVYSGYLVGDDGIGKYVAIKKFHWIIDIGRVSRDLMREKFRIQHRNLVELYGYSFHEGYLYLVYDMYERNLDKYLFSETDLLWEQRYDIIKDVALGLHQLHVSNIIHGCVKTSNVMLHDGRAKLADFRYSTQLIEQPSEEAPTTTASSPENSRWGPICKLISSFRSYYFLWINGREAPVSPADVPTPAIAPSLEKDMLDFGKMTLEVVCGRRYSSRENLPPGCATLADWVKALRVGRRLDEAVDPRLRNVFDKDQAARLLHIGLACVHQEPNRPLPIYNVRKMIEGKEAPPEES